jgi:hypothetical protein
MLRLQSTGLQARAWDANGNGYSTFALARACFREVNIATHQFSIFLTRLRTDASQLCSLISQ